MQRVRPARSCRVCGRPPRRPRRRPRGQAPWAAWVHRRPLQPISDVAYSRDNIWMEQVKVRDGRAVGIIRSRGNVVVAAAE